MPKELREIFFIPKQHKKLFKGKKRFRFSYSRPYEGNVKQIRIVRETCFRFSLIIITDHNLINSYRKTHDGASIGLDFGLKTYLTKSDGSKINSPLFFKRYQNKIRKLNKRISNAKKGSNNRRRRLFELQQAYRKINDLRSDFQWGLAHQLCKQYDYIFIEDLNITKILVKTFRGKLFKKAFERARRGKDISSFEKQEKESGFNFLHNPNNGRMQSGHIIIDGIGLFKQIIHER